MKILYVITSLRLGGAERLVTDLSKGLKDLGHDVELFVMDSTPTALTLELENAGIKIHKGWKGYINMWNPLCVFKLRRVISRGNYDIIHSHNSSSQFLTVIPSAKGSLLVTTEHNTKTRRRTIPLLKKIDSYIYAKYKKIIAVSNSTAAAFLSHFQDNNKGEKMTVVYNGINLKNFKGKQRFIDKGRREIIITMVAGFRNQKDQTTLIKSMTLLPENYILVLVGDGVNRKEAELLTEKLGVISRVKFLGFRKDVKNLLDETDIFVLSSHYEGQPISVLEAMAIGLPVIASDVEGLSETVDGAGLLFKEGDEKELAEKIKELAQNEGLYHNISQKCRERSLDFDIMTTVTRHELIYNNLLKGKTYQNSK